MHAFTGQVLAVAAIFAAAGTYGYMRVLPSLAEPWTIFNLVSTGLRLVACSGYLVISGLLTYLALFLPISRHHRSTFSLLVHFAFVVYYRIVTISYWRRFENATKHVRQEQEAILKQILHCNRNTEYGRRMNFAGIANREQYREKQPFCGFERYSDYIDRMVNKGETNLITTRDICMYNPSSGTTGKPKMIPNVISSATKRMENLFGWHYISYLLSVTPHLAPLKATALLFAPRMRTTVNGTPICPASICPRGTRSIAAALPRSTPEEAFVPLSEAAQLHIHWLFALLDVELCRIDAAYGGTMASSLDYLGKNWQLLCSDVRHGRITDNTTLAIPPDVQTALAPYLWADPLRADEIERAFEQGVDGVVSRLWPRIKIVFAIVTGAHSVYVDPIRRYLGPDIQIYSTIYVSSEMGIAGINLNHPVFTGKDPDPKDGKEHFTFVPNGGVFFEFIPLTRDENDQIHLENPTNSVFLEELELGKRYEVAVSSDTCGFYRYRMGDLIEVVGFHNQSPVFDFCARVGSLLDLRGEKTSEDMVYNSLLNCVSKHWKEVKKLVNYTATESVSLRKALETSPDKFNHVFEPDGVDGLFYVIFVEVAGMARKLTTEEIKDFDENLKAAANGGYALWRDGDLIAKPRVLVVAPETFAEFKLWSLEKTKAVSNQYKTPRYVKTEDAISFLLERVI